MTGTTRGELTAADLALLGRATAVMREIAEHSLEQVTSSLNAS